MVEFALGFDLRAEMWHGVVKFADKNERWCASYEDLLQTLGVTCQVWYLFRSQWQGASDRNCRVHPGGQSRGAEDVLRQHCERRIRDRARVPADVSVRDLRPGLVPVAARFAASDRLVDRLHVPVIPMDHHTTSKTS